MKIFIITILILLGGFSVVTFKSLYSIDTTHSPLPGFSLRPFTTPFVVKTTPSPTPAYKPSPRPVLAQPSPTPSPVYTYFPVSPTWTALPTPSPTPSVTPQIIYIYQPAPSPQIIYVTSTPQPVGASTPSPSPEPITVSITSSSNFIKISDTSFWIKSITFDLIDKSTGIPYVFRPDEYVVIHESFIGDSTINRTTESAGQLEITTNHYTYTPPQPFKITSVGQYYGWFQLYLINSLWMTNTFWNTESSLCLFKQCQVVDVELTYKITDIDFVEDINLIGLPVMP